MSGSRLNFADVRGGAARRPVIVAAERWTGVKENMNTHAYHAARLEAFLDLFVLADFDLEATRCPNIFFTSSIAAYGPTTGPTSEDSPNYPITPYGITKHAAELIHEVWLRSAAGRRLIVCRPGVIYGPGDPGNILRMIRAVKKGRFFFPGDASIRKSYGYIYGLLESIDFTMARPEPHLIYNYVERHTEPLRELVRLSGLAVGKKGTVTRLPITALVAVAHVIQTLTGGKSPIHPVRVRKAATPTLRTAKASKAMRSRTAPVPRRKSPCICAPAREW